MRNNSLGTSVNRSVATSMGNENFPWEYPQGPQYVSTGSSGPIILDLTTGGTFTRASEGSYLTKAPTDGSTSFMSFATNNVRRLEDQGDGLGALLLMEGTRTNRCLFNRQMNGANWSAGNATTTQDQNGGCDASGVADQVNASSGQVSNYMLQAGLTTQQVASTWRRAVAGTVSHQITIANGPALLAVAARATTATTTYSRNDVTGSSFPLTAGMTPVDGQDQTAVGGQVATAQNVYVDLSQLEVGAFPSSAIRVASSSPVARSTDALSYANGSYPASLITNGFTFTYVPVCSSAEMISATAAQVLCAVNTGTNMLRFQANQSTCYLFVAGSPIGNTNSLTFSRNQAITITVDFVLGKITVSGATSGNGVTTFTPATWPAGNSFVISDPTNPCFARFSNFTSL